MGNLNLHSLLEIYMCVCVCVYIYIYVFLDNNVFILLFCKTLKCLFLADIKQQPLDGEDLNKLPWDEI